METPARPVPNLPPASDPSQGYYPSPGWGWQKPSPKTYLQEHHLDQYAQPWILNLVQLIHWTPFIPAFGLAYVIFHHAGDLKPVLPSDLQVFFLLASPLVQTFGGLMGITMHEYEGWQVVYFQNPLDTQFPLTNSNNEWLREVAYKLLFILQGAGLLCFSLGVFGVNRYTLALALVSFLGAFFLPQNPKVTFNFHHQPVFPLSLWLTVVFVLNALVNFGAYFYLFVSPLTAAGQAGILAGLAPALLMIGGVVEGVIAESTFNQWWHFIAVIFLNLGILCQFYFFSLLW